MFTITDDIKICIHKNQDETINAIKNNEEYFITSTDYHEYDNPLKNEYGPICISSIILFINYIKEVKEKTNKKIIYYVYNSKNNYDLLNATFLFGCYLILVENYSVDSLLFNFCNIFNYCPQYYIGCVSRYNGYIITIKDCFKTINFLHVNKLLNIELFNLEEYLYYSNYEYRDMTMIFNKFMAMSCPSNYNINHIITDLKNKNIKNVIRLSDSKSYNKDLLTEHNILVHDLYFDDMSVPSISIVKNFMNIVNNLDNDEIVAVHCKAGIGRTAILICIWLIIKLNFKPKHAIVYIRLFRPGCIMYHQGIFLESINYFRHLI